MGPNSVSCSRGGPCPTPRTFGGEDYVGFHTMMALAPSFHMSKELPEAEQPLPVFKCCIATAIASDR